MKFKRFLDCYIPITTCNFRCHYCYIALQGAFKNAPTELKHDAKAIRRAISQERMGGPCMINLCAGGETLLSEQVIDIIYELLEEGHYLMVVTNGSLTKRFEKIANFPQNLLDRLFFKFSFHYLELKRKNLMDTFFYNINIMDKAGCSFTIEMTPNDELIPLIPEIKETCIKKLGLLCHVTIARVDRDPSIPHLSKMNFDEYCEVWGNAFKSEMFDFKKSIFYIKRKEFCYAGDWSAYINLGTGEMRKCYGCRVTQNIFDNFDKPLKFKAIGHGCSQAHCYNGHAFLTFGDIPELDTPTYDVLRNRVCEDGSQWVKPTMIEAFQTKLVETNREYSVRKKAAVNVYTFFSYPPRIAVNYGKKLVKRVIRKPKYSGQK